MSGCYLWYGGGDVKLDDMAFSNSLTVEHNVLAPGVIGHIARSRRIDASTYSVIDRWLHYDQVGSVMVTSDGGGRLAETWHPDAFGNMMASWRSGLWTDTYSSRAGWHHNTKEFDADIGLVYMYQRWYIPETGAFASKAPLPPILEHQFTAYISNPVSLTDPQGRWATFLKTLFPITRLADLTCILGYALDRKQTVYEHIGGPGNAAAGVSAFDKAAHCIVACEMERACGNLTVPAMNTTEIMGAIIDDPLQSALDIHANNVGSSRAGCPGSCHDMCEAARKKGLLSNNPFEVFGSQF